MAPELTTEILTAGSADPAWDKQLRTEVRAEVFALKLALCAALCAVSAALALQPNPWLRVLGTVGLGCMFAHAAELQHQALHGLGFRRRWANTVSGVILGIPMLISFAAYRAAHVRHHRYLGTPLNREFFDYGDQYGTGASRWSWLMRFSFVLHYRQYAGSLLKTLQGKDFDGEDAATSRLIRRDHLIIAAVAALAIAGSMATGKPWLFLLLWAVPLVAVAGPVHALIELPEHFRCETLDPDPFANSRTIRSNWLASWFTNGNNFHVEHHLMPHLPIESLSQLHLRISGKLQNFDSGYVRYFTQLLRGGAR